MIIMLIYLPIYIILILIFVFMNLFNQMVPIYVLSENNVDLFYKKKVCIYIILKDYLVKLSLSSDYLSCLIILYILYIALTLVGD